MVPICMARIKTFDWKVCMQCSTLQFLSCKIDGQTNNVMAEQLDNSQLARWTSTTDFTRKDQKWKQSTNAINGKQTLYLSQHKEANKEMIPSPFQTHMHTVTHTHTHTHTDTHTPSHTSTHTHTVIKTHNPSQLFNQWVNPVYEVSHCNAKLNHTVWHVFRHWPFCVLHLKQTDVSFPFVANDLPTGETSHWDDHDDSAVSVAPVYIEKHDRFIVKWQLIFILISWKWCKETKPAGFALRWRGDSQPSIKWYKPIVPLE